jgi:2,5-diketo-D-gluconate reductase A
MARSDNVSVQLNDGRTMPRLGLGTWQMDDQQATKAVRDAIHAGYRLIDTAAIYGNETGVGAGVRGGGVPREEIFITSKVWNDAHGSSTPRALRDTLARLRLDFLDLYLIHWPVPRQDLYVDTWRALIDLRAAGLTRSIGVSNFNSDHLSRIVDATGVVPAVNQIELHPGLQQLPLAAVHAQHGIVTQAWSPLRQGKALQNPTLRHLAHEHRRTPAQVVLRWQIQNGFAPIPKSINAERIRENAAVFDFELSPDQMKMISTLDRRERIGPDPETFG